MKNFIMFCKTYSGDLNRVSLMLESFNKYNVDGLSLYLSVPEHDAEMFKKFESKTVHVVTDESYAGKYFTDKKLELLKNYDDETA